MTFTSVSGTSVSGTFPLPYAFSNLKPFRRNAAESGRCGLKPGFGSGADEMAQSAWNAVLLARSLRI
jgi:hypothetical protein